MHDGEMLIPILVPLGFFAMAFGLVYLRTRENLAMLERGKDPRDKRKYINLKWGLMLIGAGIGLALAYIITQYVLRDTEDPALWFAFIGIGGGLGLYQSYRIEDKKDSNKVQ